MRDIINQEYPKIRDSLPDLPYGEKVKNNDSLHYPNLSTVLAQRCQRFLIKCGFNINVFYKKSIKNSSVLNQTESPSSFSKNNINNEKLYIKNQGNSVDVTQNEVDSLNLSSENPLNNNFKKENSEISLNNTNYKLSHLSLNGNKNIELPVSSPNNIPLASKNRTLNSDLNETVANFIEHFKSDSSPFNHESDSSIKVINNDTQKSHVQYPKNSPSKCNLFDNNDHGNQNNICNKKITVNVFNKEIKVQEESSVISMDDTVTQSNINCILNANVGNSHLNCSSDCNNTIHNSVNENNVTVIEKSKLSQLEKWICDGFI